MAYKERDSIDEIFRTATMVETLLNKICSIQAEVRLIGIGLTICVVVIGLIWVWT